MSFFVQCIWEAEMLGICLDLSLLLKLGREPKKSHFIATLSSIHKIVFSI